MQHPELRFHKTDKEGNNLWLVSCCILILKHISQKFPILWLNWSSSKYLCQNCWGKHMTLVSIALGCWRAAVIPLSVSWAKSGSLFGLRAKLACCGHYHSMELFSFWKMLFASGLMPGLCLLQKQTQGLSVKVPVGTKLHHGFFQ